MHESQAAGRSGPPVHQSARSSRDHNPPPLLLDPSAALSYRSLNPLGSAPAIEDLSNGSMSKYDPGKWQMQNAQNLQDSGKSAIQKTGRNQFKMLRRMYGERSEEEDLIQ